MTDVVTEILKEAYLHIFAYIMFCLFYSILSLVKGGQGVVNESGKVGDVLKNPKEDTMLNILRTSSVCYTVTVV